MAKTIYICSGSACKKHKCENKTLRKGLADSLDVERVRCQKICKGPVVGVQVDGTLQWFRKVDSTTDMGVLRKVAKGRKLPKSLEAKRAKKRAAKLR